MRCARQQIPPGAAFVAPYTFSAFMNDLAATPPLQEVGVLEVLRAQAKAGIPIHYKGPLSGVEFSRHVKMVGEIQRTLGIPVKVIYTPQ